MDDIRGKENAVTYAILWIRVEAEIDRLKL